MYGNILQILPANPGWEAVYAINRHKKGQNYMTVPLNCWAVVEFKVNNNSREFNTIVVGMVIADVTSPVLDFVDKTGDFIGYNFPGCNVDWHVQAEKYHRRTVDYPAKAGSPGGSEN